MRAKRVLIVNRGMHDYSSALNYGEQLVDLTKGRWSRVNVTSMVREMEHTIRQSTKSDWLLISGPATINCIACVLFALHHRQLNLLIFSSRDNGYIPRTITFEED